MDGALRARDTRPARRARWRRAAPPWGALLAALLGLGACAPASSPGPAIDASSAPAANSVAVPAAPQIRERLRVVYPTLSISALHVVLPRDAGYYTAQGLDVDLQYVVGVPTVVAAL